MSDTNIPVISYAAHEGEMTRMHGIIKHMIVMIIICIILLFASNALWLYAWMQYDYSSDANTTTTTTEENVTVDGKDGVANYIGNDGDISNGTDNSAKSEDHNKNTKSADKGE